jgi:hypothetical protein
MWHKREVVKAVAYHLATLPCLSETPPYFLKHLQWHYSEKIRTECRDFFEMLLKMSGEDRRRFVEWLTGILDK